MPRLPKEVFGKSEKSTSKESVNFNRSNLKSNFLIYSFLIIIGIELLSVFLVNFESYQLVIYPFLSQFEVFIGVLTIALYSDRLKFCERKKTSLLILSAYFLFNSICVFIPITNYFYSIVINILILSISGYLFFTQFNKKQI